jgi:hypothetical protein
MYVKRTLGVSLSDSEVDYVSLLHDGTLGRRKWYTLRDLQSKGKDERKLALLGLAREVRSQLNLPVEMEQMRRTFWDRVKE